MNRRRIWIVVGAIGLAVVAGWLGYRVCSSGTSSEVAPYQTPFDPDIDFDDPEPDLPIPDFNTHAAPFLKKHCLDCHSGDRAKGGIHLDSPSESVWAKAGEAVRSRRMPPQDRPKPDAQESAEFLRWVNASVRPTPGRVTLRRLNRAEYDRTIRDLVGVTFKPSADFPADDTGDGFDTNADVLSVSPLLIEKYLAAAEAIVDAAANDPELWRKVSTPPTEDFVPFVLRGAPPQRNDAVKDQRIDAPPDPHVAEIERAFSALQAFADRAFRRPVTHVEMGRLMKFVERSIANGERVDAGFKLALTAVLVSPHFLFRVELDSGAERRLNDFELATRLSYFLWSSLPDEELFRLAAAGKLSVVRALVPQVRRMLRDPKSRALAENFSGQWLQTRSLKDAPIDADLRHAMLQETELFFDHTVRTDRPVLDFLVGDYTFVNDRLAKHYAIPGIEGSHFRNVDLAGTSRAGVLTHASVLTVTSGPTRTSPVKRGKWILDNILGEPPPAPPPGVDSLKSPVENKATSVRELLTQHRSRAECASCHAHIDPLGFGLENFDAIGKWREQDGSFPIDATGTLPDGRSFAGPAELCAILAKKPGDFAHCFTEKLLTYALGRSLTPSDRQAIERIVRQAARNDYQFSSLVIAIVRSDPFQKRGAP